MGYGRLDNLLFTTFVNLWVHRKGAELGGAVETEMTVGQNNNAALETLIIGSSAVVLHASKRGAPCQKRGALSKTAAL